MVLEIMTQEKFDSLIENNVIDAIRNKKGFDYNTFINKDLNRVIKRNKTLYIKLGIWGDYPDYHIEDDIPRLSGLVDHRTTVCIDLSKISLYLGVNPNKLKAPLIQIPALFNFLNDGSIEYVTMIINERKQYDSDLGYGLDNYFNGFNTYFVNPCFFKYGHSIPICHIPNLRWENGTSEILSFVNNAFFKKYNQYLFFLHSDEKFE